MSSTAMWVAVLACSLGCFAFKLAGQSLPESLLKNPRIERMAALLPIALLSALTAVLTFADGRDLTLDARAFGLVVAVIALVLDAPFLVVVVSAAAAAGLLRLFVG